MMKVIKIYAWSSIILFILTSLAIRPTAMLLKAYMDRGNFEYPIISKIGFIITPWLGVVPLLLACFLISAQIWKYKETTLIHCWAICSMMFLAGLFLAFIAYTMPWVPVGCIIAS